MKIRLEMGFVCLQTAKQLAANLNKTGYSKLMDWLIASPNLSELCQVSAFLGAYMYLTWLSCNRPSVRCCQVNIFIIPIYLQTYLSYRFGVILPLTSVDDPCRLVRLCLRDWHCLIMLASLCQCLLTNIIATHQSFHHTCITQVSAVLHILF